MFDRYAITRRRLIRNLSAGTALVAASGLPLRKVRASDLVVGFLYVGPKDDYGYNQAHAEGAEIVKGMEGVTVVEEENVPETVDVQKSMESMINFDGAQLLFPTSFGYFDPHMINVAQKYPDLPFRHCGGLWQEDVHPANTGSYFGYIGMGQYLNGIVAGHTTQNKKLGFIAAKPIPQVLRNINSYTLGARSVDPEITTQVIFTGEWSLPVKEAEATQSLIDQGADVVTCHVDAPKVVMETAERRGIYCCGYHANQAPLAPNGYLTGAEWDWGNVYTMFIENALSGEPLPNFVRGGLAEGFVKMSDYGPAVSDAARNQANAVKDEMLQGGYIIYKGPMMSNDGKEVIAAGTEYGEQDIWLEQMDWLVDGVIGSTS